MFDSPFIIPIVGMLIPIVAIITSSWTKVQNRRMDLMERSTSELGSASLHRIEKLEARIAVLERIATDKRLALADEIDALAGLDHSSNNQALPAADGKGH